MVVPVGGSAELCYMFFWKFCQGVVGIQAWLIWRSPTQLSFPYFWGCSYWPDLQVMDWHPVHAVCDSWDRLQSVTLYWIIRHGRWPDVSFPFSAVFMVFQACCVGKRAPLHPGFSSARQSFSCCQLLVSALQWFKLVSFEVFRFNDFGRDFGGLTVSVLVR